jgi:cytochrome c peroxidase
LHLKNLNFSDLDGTYDNIGIAIAAFERSKTVTRFNSKFDKFWAACQETGIDVSTTDTTTNLTTLPDGILTVTQLKGLVLFNDPDKGNCAVCHSTTGYTNADGTFLPPLFTDFTYDNLGIPTNPRVEELSGVAQPDLGLGGRADINDPAEYGKFKVPTLRNVAKSDPYAHNGYFPTLKEIVHFYNTWDVGTWESPEVPETVNDVELGDLGLSSLEEWQIVDFMKTLTDPPRNEPVKFSRFMGRTSLECLQTMESELN